MFMKILRTNNDLLFWIIAIIWMLLCIMSIFIEKLDGFYVNNVFVIIICILIIAKNKCDKFSKWLKKEFTL